VPSISIHSQGPTPSLETMLPAKPKPAAWGAEGLLIYMLAFVVALIWPLAASAASVATNGSATSGTILVAGQTNSYTFTATAGENQRHPRAPL